MFIWLWKAKEDSDKFIELNVDSVIEDIDRFESNKLIYQIKKMLEKKRNIKSSDDETSQNKIMNKMICNIIFNEGNEAIDEFERNEIKFSSYNQIQKYNKYLFMCLDQHFNK